MADAGTFSDSAPAEETVSSKKTNSRRHHARKVQAAEKEKGVKSRLLGVGTEPAKDNKLQLKSSEKLKPKRDLLDARHEYLISMVAQRLPVDVIEIEDCILEKIDLFDKFFEANGCCSVLFYYDQDQVERKQSVTKPSIRLNKIRIYATDARKEAFPGICVFFIRSTLRAITSANIALEVNCGMLQSQNGGGVLSAVESVFTSVFIPALTKQTNWGKLSDKLGESVRADFMSKLDAFVSVLANARQSLSDTISLSPCQHVNVASIGSVSGGFLAAASSQETVELLEATLTTWCKEIEQMLTTSGQMRKEADDIGPKAELEYWKKRMAQFNSLLSCVRHQEFRTVLMVLNAAKSKTLKVWKNLDVQITNASNEAKDNVKFLYTLEKYCEPLYKSDPVSVVESIPCLMNAIRMINSYSRYYNTPERMTALFAKVTNQMITACRDYITNNGYYSLWDQETKVIIEKLLACIQLNHCYQSYFHETKMLLEEQPNERPFEFSEMYIFGRFNTFCQRLKNIIEILETIEVYSSLLHSRIEGIEQLGAKYTMTVTAIKKKPYDLLDHRRLEFDNDFEEFRSNISDLHRQLEAFMDQCFEQILSTERAMRLLQRFENLALPGLDIQCKYQQILVHYSRDIDLIQRLYTKHKLSPPNESDVSPIANRISWARQLFQRIDKPMASFRRFKDLMKLSEAQKIIKKYNNMGKVLVEYEVLYHDAWLRQIEIVQVGLNASVLVRHPNDPKQLFVNFDPAVLTTIKEINCLERIGLNIPHTAQSLRGREQQLKKYFSELKMLLTKYKEVKQKVQLPMEDLMVPHFETVDKALSPGLTFLSWSSMNLDNFIAAVQAALKNVEVLIDWINDVIQFQMRAVFKEMLDVPLCAMPEGQPWTIKEFVGRTQELCANGSVVLEAKSALAEKAAEQVISVVLGDYKFQPEEPEALPPLTTAASPEHNSPIPATASSGRRRLGSPASHGGPKLSRPGSSYGDIPAKLAPGQLTLHRQMEQRMKLKEAAQEVRMYFSRRNLETLLQLTKSTLETIKRRVSSSSFNLYSDREDTRQKDNQVAFRADITLAIPNVVMQPALDDIQQAVNKAAQYVVASSKGVLQWGRKRETLDISQNYQKGYRRKKSSHFREFASRSTESQVSRFDVRRSQVSRVERPDLVAANLTDLLVGGKDHSNSYYKYVSENKDVMKLLSLLSTAVNSSKQTYAEALEKFNRYGELWQADIESTVAEFLKSDPNLREFQAKILHYEELEKVIAREPETIALGPICLYSEMLKISLRVETKQWKIAYGRSCNTKYANTMSEVFAKLDDFKKRLSSPIEDLEDIRSTMVAIQAIREDEIFIDMKIQPIEESFSLLNHHEVAIPRDQSDKVHALRYTWEELLTMTTNMQSHLIDIQPDFKGTLVSNVAVFVNDVDRFSSMYDSDGPMVPNINPREASDRLQMFQGNFDSLWRHYITYSGGEELFGLPVTDYPSLHRIKKELNLLQKLYGLYNAVMDSIDGYYDLLWSEVDIGKINNELLDFQNRCRKLPRAMKDWQAFKDLSKKINDFNETCPLLEQMANKAMKQRHWDRLEVVTGHKFDVDSPNLQLRNIMSAPLLKNAEEIEDVCVAAVKELDIEAKLKGVVNEWSTQELQFSMFKKRGELMLKGDASADIVSLMEDSLMILGSLMSNRYNVPFKKEIQEWVQNLTQTTEILEKWMVVQNLWVYLEAVFVGGDIATQLPKEAKRFQNIDKSWLKIMTRAHEVPNVVQCCVGDEMLGQLLPHLLEQLELCQKSLTGYLEKKRLVFPRFFFVSDPALLEILGQASDSHTIQAHLLGVFDNVKSITFHEKDYDRILSFSSREGETVELEQPVMAQGNVELWLGNLLNGVMTTIHSIIRTSYRAMQDPNFQLLEFLHNSAAQIGLLGLQMLWTRDSQLAISKARADKKIMQATNQYFLEILNNLIGLTLQELSKMDRTKYETLITIHVHQRDIFDGLVRMHIRNPYDFEWLKQSRFYFDDDSDKCLVKITDVTFIYQNEFLGCTDRLVITPLTDRCYISLSQALGMALGGAPAGPAGTGKTETTKDMGKALGKFVVVFNCSDQMDYRGLGRIYKGLAQSGSWGCFDEFNRIELPVLSVAAQQIATVLTCKKERKPQFTFSDGDVVSMNPEFGLFLTMNPGYAGRQELPENLKINFRPVAMMVPDRQIIIRVKLASAGFLENVLLACKFYTLYKLCEEQLTKQVHYDFGLRNILSVLRTLGAVKRQNREDSETKTVMRVLRDMNLSKLIDEDEPLFLSLINDLFPGVMLDKSGYPELDAAIAAQVEEAGLVNHPSWKLKLIQLFETQRVRHGMMTLGPTGTGKTSCIHVLMKAMTACGEPHREMRMNPKSITAPQMFGRLDVATNDWTDGIFSTLWRKTLKSKKTDHIWIVLDGPVDALWIENLNSVLDDNKTLTLANGDRIPMAPNCKIVFEPHNIDNASPATVSRNGMVYMSSSALDWRPILQGWLKKQSGSETETLMPLFESCFTDLCIYCTTNLNPKMELLECNYIAQSISLLQGLILSQDEMQVSPAHLGRLFLFCLMWSVGSILELDDREKMEMFLREKASHLDFPPVDPSSGDTMFEYVVGENGEWQHWQERVPEYKYPSDSTPEYASILVPNVDNVRTDFLIDTVAKQQKSVLLIGEQGTAKTVMVKGYCARYDPERHLLKSLNFSSATTPLIFQRTIESYVDKRMGTTYGPPAGKKMTVFIDDINMPIINEWGDQVTNEIVRQTMEMNGFYNLEKPGEFTNIVDVQFIGATIHPGGGRNDIPQRLKRQFAVFNCTLPSNASIDKIFSSLGCGHFCSEREFRSEVIDLAQKLISCTRKLWQTTKAKMLPTPAKFHYVFNLRDLSRVWEGMLNVTSEVCNSADILLALWKHECTRVIADRFTTIEDTAWFIKALERISSEELSPELASRLPDEPYFVDFLREAPEATGDEPDDADLEAPKIYEPIPSDDELEKKLHMYMIQYNEAIRGSGLDLVFFRDAMIHLVRISRIIRTARGNALLVGVGGSGKQSLTRMASFIAGYSCFQITLTRSYNANNLMDDLKDLYRTTGGQGKGVTFIFTDNEIKDENFLEYMNNVLSSGEVSNLFARDELDEIMNDLIPVMKKQFGNKQPPTQENLYDYFLSRVRRNLHVVLCFSPVGEKFRNRSLKFPGLISGCTMDWFNRWPRDALVAVARHFLSNYDIKCQNAVKEQLIETMGTIQDGVSEKCSDYFNRYRRSTHVTPMSYLSFLNGYKTIYSSKVAELGELADRMNTGLNKLVEASESVAQLSKELAVKEKELAVASAETEKVLAEVTESAQAAEKVKAQVQKVKDKAEAIVVAITKDKGAAEEKLEAAKPALDEAEAALQTIKAADIATVRKLAKPPHLIMRIMDSVLLLFNRRVDPVTPDPDRPCAKPSWSESLKLMSGGGFLNNLVTFSKDLINEETVELLAPYMEMPDYTFENAKKVCGNVAGLCSWTKAMAFFYAINKEVLPLKANLAVQESRLSAANADLEKAQSQLDEKQRELNEVQAMYDEAMRKKESLLEDAETCRRKMDAASALINGLGGERTRWTAESKEFEAQIGRLVGDAVLCTGFLSYSGPFNQEFRLLLIDQWKSELKRRQIPFSSDINLVTMLTNSTTVSEWNIQGLPNDELSIQNGIIVTKATRYPLLIDPQTQGKDWVKNKEPNITSTNLNHKYFRTMLEDCLSQGRALLIEDVGEELDPVLDNILEKNFIKSGSTYKVKVGDKEIDVMNGFTLYITTKLANPAYTPEVFARTSIIDFTVTMKGLGDQLLGRVIRKEKSELESEREALMQDVTTNKKQMKELGDNLLFRLTSTKGSLVDDESLIDVLRITKTTSKEVSQKLHIAAETEVKITTAREEFRPVATRGSILYFLLVEMSMVNCMYQTSLSQFLRLFDMSIDRSPKAQFTNQRIEGILDYLTYEVFKYTCRGLYETHKFLFTLLLALKIDLESGRVKHNEFQTLIKGGAALDLKAVQVKPFKWINDMTWLNLVELSRLPQFTEILNQISRNEKAWKTWYESDAPEEAAIPDGYSSSLDTTRRLLLIRCWCSDRVLPQARKYVAESLGERYAEGVILDLKVLWEESDPETPMICLLSMGSDPTSLIESLAKKMNIDCRFVSMGQGQEVPAGRLLQLFMSQGGWTLLQNCHLGLNFLDELLSTIKETKPVHNAFRVWITTEVHPHFPISLLQMSIKFTNEPPQGIKAGIKRSYTGSITQDTLDFNNIPEWKPMLYAIAFLHTTVQERRKFGPLGWNIPYEFNQGDLTSTIEFVRNHLDDLDPKKGISWSTVHYMVGEVQYGGRVTDDFDKRLLNTFAKVWFGEHMFSPSFRFYEGYVIPKCANHTQFMDSIEELPLVDTPEAFGLHPNADITYQDNTARTLLDTILSIQPKDSSSGGGETRESVVQRLANDMLEKLPAFYVQHQVKSRLQKMGPIKPMNIFLRQEIDRMQRVISTVEATLTDLNLAIDGTIIMSENLRDALDKMFDAKVPTVWEKISWQSSTIGFWFTDLLERDAQFRSWIFKDRPLVFFMTGFFNPQGFLTAMRQEVTRAHKGWALDNVVLHNEVLRNFKDDITAAPAEGVYVHGLYLDGAGWDRRNVKLAESANKALFTQMPVVWIFAIQSSQGKDGRMYECPVYKKPNRTDLTYITSLLLKTTQSPEHWILRGVALLCDIK